MVEKETVQPHVVHTTVPIHEVHHKAANHHETSALPALSMAEFKQKGGVLGGREERYDAFEGEPKHIGGTLAHMMEGKTSKRDSDHGQDAKYSSMHGDFDPLDGKRSDMNGGAERRAENAERRVEGSVPGTRHGLAAADQSFREHNAPVGSDLRNPASSKSKASLGDKLNPTVDADGDGKAGLMN